MRQNDFVEYRDGGVRPKSGVGHVVAIVPSAADDGDTVVVRAESGDLVE